MLPLDPDQAEDLLILERVVRVEFYKRDLIPTDLICCDVTQDIEPELSILTFHEEWDGFDKLVSQLEILPAFDRGWRRQVVLPPFAESRFVAYQGQP